VIRFVAKWLALASIGLVAFSVFVVLVLRWLPPPTSSFMVRAKLADARIDIRYDWVPFERISPDAAMAVIAAEDQWFPFHTGFDLESIRDAAERNSVSRSVRGASTISQQVAKNLFLWPERSYVRKALEVYFTMLIEWLWPKERIVEVYLNVAEFGRGVYGVEAAARRFFGKSASALDAYESALLAAVLPNPRRFRVERPTPYVADRRDWIVAQAQGLGGRRYLAYLDEKARKKAPEWVSEGR
jgi:monofunctional glycosyltransferase